MSNELQTIDLAALAQVSGGAASTTSTTATNDQILTALNGILDTIKNLGQPSSNQGLNQQEMLMLMMIMSQRNQTQIAYANPWSQEPIIRYY